MGIGVRVRVGFPRLEHRPLALTRALALALTLALTRALALALALALTRALTLALTPGDRADARKLEGVGLVRAAAAPGQALG